MSDRGHGVATRTLRGMAWAYGAYVGGRALVLVATAILARLLTPSDFGVVALALTFMMFLDTIKDLGLGQALIVGAAEEEPERAQTAFGWGVLIGFALSALTAVIAPLAATFFHEPDLRGLLPVLGLTFLLRGLGATHYAIARKQLNFRVRTASEMADVITRGVVGIGLALSDFGAWSLVIGYVTGAAASTIVLWTLVKFRPRARLTRSYLRDMLAFGGMLTIVDIGAVFAYNLDYLFIGRVLGATALGLYSIAFRLPELVVMNLAIVAGEVLFPAYAAIDHGRLREAYLVALRYTAMLTMPVAVALIVLAEPIVLVLFGDQWERSIDVMRVLTAYALIITLAIPAGTVFKATRQAWIMVAFTIPAVSLLALLLALFADEGLMAVALCTTAIQAFSFPITVLVASRRLKLPYGASLRVLAPGTLGSAAMAAAMLPVVLLIGPNLLVLLVGAACGVVAYLGVLMLVAGDDVRRLREMAFPAKPLQEPAPQG